MSENETNDQNHSDDTADSRDNVFFNVLRNALYHQARRRRIEFWNRGFTFVVVLLGAATFGKFASEFGIQDIWTGALVAVVATFQLVLDLSGAARQHQTLQRDYFSLLADVEEELKPSRQDVSKWRSRMIRISGEEPPVLRAVDAKAHNDALAAMGTHVYPKDQRLVIPWHHRLRAHLQSFEGYEYITIRDLNTPVKN